MTAETMFFVPVQCGKTRATNVKQTIARATSSTHTGVYRSRRRLVTTRGISNSPWWKWGKAGGDHALPQKTGWSWYHYNRWQEAEAHTCTRRLQGCVCEPEIRPSSRLHNNTSLEMSFKPIKKFANERTLTNHQHMQ